MKKVIWVIGLTVGAISASFPQQFERGNLEGTVVSVEDKQPIYGANILLQGTVLGTSTNSNGEFVLRNIPIGGYVLTVSMIGYKRKEVSTSVQKDQQQRFVIELEQSAVQTEPVVITANKREQSLQEVPISVSVVDDQTIKYRNAITVDDALRYVPGVNITRSQVNVRGSTGYSYGVGTRVLLLVDGLPFLTGDTGEIIWESIPTTQIDRIEVVKGAGSALYGSSALGGVINIITKSVPETPETQFRFYGGLYGKPNYSTWRWTQDTRSFGGVYASHQQRVGNISFAVGGSRTLDDGFKRNDFWKRWNAWTRVGYDISPYQSLAFSFSVLDQRRGNFLYWKNLDHALEPKDDRLGERVQSLRWNLGGNYKQFLSNDLYYTLRVSWFRSKWEDNIPSRFDSAGSSSQSDFVVGELQTNYQPSEQQMLTAGVSGSFNDVLAESIFGKHSAGGGALYLQDEVKFIDDLIVTIGGRFDFQNLKEAKTVSQFNPKLGMVFNPNISTTLRASVGRGFRAPSVAEVFTKTEAGGVLVFPNPDLLPERSWSFEIGCSIVPTENISVDLSLFRNELWDLIEPAFSADGSIRFQNITRARSTGLELSLGFNLLRRIISNRISYTYVYPEDVTKGDILKYRPRHLLYIGSEVAIEPIRFGFDFRFLSKIERIDEEFVLLRIVPDGDQRVPVYITDFHFSSDWKFAGLPIVSAFHVHNLFQYYYADFIGNLGPMRDYVFTLETKF